MINKRFKHIIFNLSGDDIESDVSDYFKLKFNNKELSDYEFLLWVKLFYYMKHNEETSNQSPSPCLLNSIRQEYNLPIPTNDLDSDALFIIMNSHDWIKIQDNTGKYLFGPFSKSEWMVPSFSINRFQRSFNRATDILRSQIISGDITDELREKTMWMLDCIRGLNYYVGHFLGSYVTSHEQDIPDKDHIKQLSPYSDYQNVCKELYGIIMSICNIPKKDWESSGFANEMRMPVLLPKFIEMKGIAAFSCLSGFFIDASYFSFDYEEPLINILFFLHFNFHNSLLWRIDFAASPLNIGTPVEQRGQKDNTTQLKIYLFDSQDRPRVIRIDMPHKGGEEEKCLHFNVKPVFEGENFDHQVITGNCKQIQFILESVREAMIRECFCLINIKDSNEKADDDILEEMQRFLAYDTISAEYIAKEQEKSALDIYNTKLQTNFSSLHEALENAYLDFYNKF